MTWRIAALSLVMVCATGAEAQSFTGTIWRGLKFMQDRELLPLPVQTNPTQPSGNPIPPVRQTGDLPRPGNLGPEGGALHVIHSGIWNHDDPPNIHITDGVEFTDRGYHCWADEMIGNQDTNVYTLKGNVRVLGQEESIYGESVTVDFTHRTFLAENSESTLKPGLMRGYMKSELYVKAGSASGSAKEVFAEHSSTTTCSYPKPHFELEADSTDVRPGRRVIFRKLRIKILGRTVLKLPFLSIPIDERTYNNLPVVGKGPAEGYFIKSRWSFPLSHDSTLVTRLDEFSRLGTGVGVGIKYDNPDMRGNLSFYTIQGRQSEFEILSQHRQRFRWGTFTLDSSYEDNNYLISAQSKMLSTRAALYVPRGQSSDRLNVNISNSSSFGSTTRSESVSFNDSETIQTRRRQPGATSNGSSAGLLTSNFTANFSNNSTSFTGGTPIERKQLDVNLQVTDDLEIARARLDFIRSIPIGASAGFFTTSDVTPALTFLSDSNRLFGRSAGSRFPFQLQLGYGQYTAPNHHSLSRADFDFLFQSPSGGGGGYRTYQNNSFGSGYQGGGQGQLPETVTPIDTGPKAARRWTLNYQGEFKQDVYSDNTAQYILQGASQLNYSFKNNSRFNISYNYMRPEGFSPLQIDRRGQQNSFITDLSVSPFKNALLGFATGYDFNLIKQHQPTPWQQVGMQARYSLLGKFDFRALSTYDTIRHTFSSTRLDLTWRPGSTYVSFGAKYDGVRHTWAAANIYVDGMQWGRLRTSVLLNYNGYTRHFETQHFSFIYDLHCAEAVLQVLNNETGFNSGRQIFFFIRLKALPFDTPFGTGQRGQPIGTGTGRDF